MFAAHNGDAVRIESTSDPANPDAARYQDGTLLPGPHATLAGPSFDESLEQLRL